MAQRDSILSYADQLLEVDKFHDFGPIGLHVIGKPVVNKIVTGVSASLDLYQAAADRKADMILVHHGEFWDNVTQVVNAQRKARLQVLFDHNITLAAYHLPLDAHPTIGNNALLIKAAGLKPEKTPFAVMGGQSIGMIGQHKQGITLKALVNNLTKATNGGLQLFDFGPKKIRRVGFVSGGGASALNEAIALGLDAFVTGESKENTYHLAKEAGIHLIYLGHYHSEILGIKALGETLAKKFSVAAEYVDIPCPL